MIILLNSLLFLCYVYAQIRLSYMLILLKQVKKKEGEKNFEIMTFIAEEKVKDAEQYTKVTGIIFFICILINIINYFL